MGGGTAGELEDEAAGVGKGSGEGRWNVRRKEEGVGRSKVVRTSKARSFVGEGKVCFTLAVAGSAEGAMAEVGAGEIVGKAVLVGRTTDRSPSGPLLVKVFGVE